MGLKLTVEIEGDTYNDLEIALDEVRRLLGQECTSGGDSNDSGRFSFEITGEEKESADALG